MAAEMMYCRLVVSGVVLLKRLWEDYRLQLAMAIACSICNKGGFHTNLLFQSPLQDTSVNSLRIGAQNEHYQRGKSV